MPIFKVVITEQVTQKYTAYVEAATKRGADHWASMVENASLVGCKTGESLEEGIVEDIEPASEVPPGYKLYNAPVPQSPRSRHDHRTPPKIG